MTTTPLAGLPTEIVREISSYLSYGSHLALLLTCRELHAKLEDLNQPSNPLPSGANDKVYSMADLLEIERWPDYNASEYKPLESNEAARLAGLLRLSPLLKNQLCLQLLQRDDEG